MSNRARDHVVKAVKRQVRAERDENKKRDRAEMIRKVDPAFDIYRAED